MSIKIITPGKLAAKKRYRITCHTCSGVFECLGEDAQLVLSTDERDSDTLVIACPTEGCGGPLYFGPSCLVKESYRPEQPKGYPWGRL